VSDQSNFDPWDLPRFHTHPGPGKRSGAVRLWEGWKRLGMAAAKANLYVLLFIIYWTVFAVTAVVAKILGRDWLGIRFDPRKIWRAVPPPPDDIEEFHRQF